MSDKNTTKTAPADVAAKAVEEKLVVPAQAEGEQDGPKEPLSGEKDAPELSVIEGGKKTLKERFAQVAEKVKANKKNVAIAVGAAASVATLAFVQYAKKKAEAALFEAANEETVTEDGQTETTDSAA